MPEGITLKRIIDMDETEQLSSSDYVLVDSASGGNRKYKLGEDLNNLKEDFHSYHSELGAGYAEQLVSSIVNTDQTPYNFRKVPYDATLEQVEGIVGCDVVLNQLCNGASVTVPNGHKYYMLKGGTTSVGASTGTAITGLTSGTDMISDLTQTFESQIADYVYGLETATAGAGVAWLKEHFSKIFDAGYIAYNAGTMVCVSGLSAKKTVGFNQCTENWRQGDWNNNSDSRVSLENTDRIPLLGGETYYIYCSSPNNNYKVSGALLDRIDSTTYFAVFGWTTGIVYTPTKNCYLALVVSNNNNTSITPEEVEANCKICVNLSDPTRNGTYEPYTEHTYPLDSSIDLHGILKLDSNNNLYADGDVYPPSGQVSHRYGIADMGSVNWYMLDNGLIQCEALTDISYPTAWNVVPSILCPKYITVTPNDIVNKTVDKSISITPQRRLVVNDSVYTSASDFKAAMSGVYLVYPLATPTTETAEPYNPNQICDPNGTEEYISDTVAPVGHVTKYPLDIAGRLDNILSMPTANGTYTLRAVVSDGKVTYSWVSA